MTTLSEAIRTHGPKIQGTAPIGDGRTAVDFVGAEDYERMKQVAVILARACEIITKHNSSLDEVDRLSLIDEAYTDAKKLMEEK